MKKKEIWVKLSKEGSAGSRVSKRDYSILDEREGFESVKKVLEKIRWFVMLQFDEK